MIVVIDVETNINNRYTGEKKQVILKILALQNATKMRMLEYYDINMIKSICIFSFSTQSCH